MSNPTCPKCKSTNVAYGYPLDAGTDKCNACGYLGPVTEFHQLVDWQKVVAAHDKFVSDQPPTDEPETHKKYWWQDE